MRCEVCHGTGRAQVEGPLPCPECDGGGIVHCCDGLQACNEPPPRRETNDKTGSGLVRNDRSSKAPAQNGR